MLLPAFILMGLGMGFVISPMSTAAMNAVSADKAGAASGILSMSRMVGGTFGVAALGALFQHLSAERLADSLAGTGVTAAQRERLVENIGAGAGATPSADSTRPPPSAWAPRCRTPSSTRSPWACGWPPAWPCWVPPWPRC